MINCSVALAAVVKRCADALPRCARCPKMALAAALLAATVFAAFPALAQESPPPLKDCRALIKSARGELARTPETIIEDIPGGCRFTHVGFFISDSVVADVDEMTLLSPDLLATYPKNEVFLSADLSLKGFAFPPGPKLNLHLVYSTDPDERTSTLDRLSIDAGHLGRFTVSGRLSEFDNTDVGSPLSEQSGVLNEVQISLDDNGIVGEILVPILSGSLDSLEDGRDATSATIRSLPRDLISEESAAAVTHFISALPNPRGKWTLTFQSQEGLPISALNAPSFYELIGRFPGDARIQATANP